jgi:hypothetical protein
VDLSSRETVYQVEASGSILHRAHTVASEEDSDKRGLDYRSFERARSHTPAYTLPQQSSTVLGKRKATSPPVQRAPSLNPNHDDIDNHVEEYAIEEEANSPNLAESDNVKKRRMRARKPAKQPPSKLSGRPPPPRIKKPPPVIPVQRFKREANRRWSTIHPYVAMMKVVMKVRMFDDWLALLSSVAEVSAPGETKDLRVSSRGFHKLQICQTDRFTHKNSGSSRLGQTNTPA